MSDLWNLPDRCRRCKTPLESPGRLIIGLCAECDDGCEDLPRGPHYQRVELTQAQAEYRDQRHYGQ